AWRELLPAKKRRVVPLTVLQSKLETFLVGVPSANARIIYPFLRLLRQLPLGMPVRNGECMELVTHVDQHCSYQLMRPCGLRAERVICTLAQRPVVVCVVAVLYNGAANLASPRNDFSRS